MKQPVKKAVLAYSGGLDTSIAIPWLRENYGCEVVAMVGNVGQDEAISILEDRAVRSGASRVYVEDLRREFVTGFLWPLVKSGALYEGRYLLGSALSRPLLARRQVEIALREGADALVHGCAAKGTDQVRFELTYKAFAPDLPVIAPCRAWDMQSRSDAIAYARKHNIPVPPGAERVSRDSNLWHMSHEGGILEDPTVAPPRDLYLLTLDPRDCPDGESEITIDFEQGLPVGLNGHRIPPVQLIADLNEIAGTNGVGRVDMVENDAIGMKSRGVYETPGGTLLMTALRELESLCLDRQTCHRKGQLSGIYAQLIYDGHWYTPLREALDAFFGKVSECVTGSVSLRLYKGNLTVTGRQSPTSLHRCDIASFFDAASGYNRDDAEGFINLLGLPAAVRSRLAPNVS